MLHANRDQHIFRMSAAGKAVISAFKFPAAWVTVAGGGRVPARQYGWCEIDNLLLEIDEERAIATV
jgi:hypothetical protein